MIRFSDDAKSIKIPRNLGPNQSSVEGGITAEEAQALIDASLEDYTLTDDFATVNGRPITEGGNIEISGGTPTQVTVTQVVTGGTKIATIGVDGTETDLYAPASGGGVTPQDVQDAIDQALQDYPTSAVTQDLDERVTELENASVDYATTADTQALETAISGKSTVVWNQIATGGTKVAEITVDGTKTDVYAPQGGGVTPQDVQDAIDSALTNYYTKSQADSAFTDPAEAEQIATDAVNAFSQNDFQPFASQVGQDIGALQSGKQDKLTPGTGIQISGNTISCTVSGYTLPVATQQVLGGVKVGSGLTIDNNGVLSVSGGSSTYDGYVFTTFDEYNAMTQSEKEAWYDAIKADVLSGNCKYGLIEEYDYAVPGDYGNSQVKYRVYLFNELEDGYPSLHYSGAEFSGDSGSYRAWNARITRGGSIETWNRGVDMSKFTENENDRRMFTITTGLTAYGYFDAYMFNRCFSEPRQSWDFYSAVGSMPLRIVSPHQDNPDEFDLVCTANILACGEAPSGLYQDGYAKRFVFRYFLNGELYEAVMDSVSGGSGDGLHVIHNYEVYGNWTGTQQAYNALQSYDNKVIYHIDQN